MARHNKKRNVGLIYEFLVRTASEAIIEGNDSRRDTALKIIKKHFGKKGELYKEFRLFHSLIATTVKSESVADRILESAKEASRNYDESILDHEKSLLIRSINHNLNDNNFYDRRVNEYTIYATVQTLLNEWRKKTPSDIVVVAEYEQQLKEWLMKEKKVSTVDEVSEADPLVEKLMLKKFNERYAGLTEDQSNLIRSYIFSDGETKDKMGQIKESTLNKIDSYLKDKAKKGFITEKLQRAQKIIQDISTEPNDDNIRKFLDVAKLNQEISSED